MVTPLLQVHKNFKSSTTMLFSNRQTKVKKSTVAFYTAHNHYYDDSYPPPPPPNPPSQLFPEVSAKKIHSSVKYNATIVLILNFSLTHHGWTSTSRQLHANNPSYNAVAASEKWTLQMNGNHDMVSMTTYTNSFSNFSVAAGFLATWKSG